MTKAKTKTSKYRLIQKYINKLMSEEWIAGQLYILIKLHLSKEDNLLDNIEGESNSIYGEIDYEHETKIITPFSDDKFSFGDTANDELMDHFLSIKFFAEQYGFTTPKNVNDFFKFANPEDVELFHKANMSTNDNLKFLKIALQSEDHAISSYKKALEDIEKTIDVNDIDLYEIAYDLKTILSRILYEEIDHYYVFQSYVYQVEAELL